MKNIKTFEEFAQVNSDEETLGLKGEEIFVDSPEGSIDPEDTYDDAEYINGDEDEEDDDDEEEDDDFDEIINTEEDVLADDDTEDSNDLESGSSDEFDEKF